MVAAINGHLEIVRYLSAEHGADLHTSDDGGITALIGAAIKGHVAIVQYLAEQLATEPCSQPPRILAPRKLHLNLGDLSAHLGVETEISMLKR